MAHIKMSISELENILTEQKKVTAEYITRNLTVFEWFKSLIGYDSERIKEEIRRECLKSGFANDFKILKKYVIED